MHYTNEKKVEGIIDSSGVRINYTSKLRQFDSGVMVTGKLHQDFEIPPGEEAYSVDGPCRTSCTNKIIDSIKVFAYFPHGHLLLRKISTNFIKPDGTADVKWAENNYSFSHQMIYALDNPMELSKGFEATTTCIYNSEGKSEKTLGGEETNQEMCINLLFYYPRENGIKICFLTGAEDICDNNSKIERVISIVDELCGSVIFIRLFVLGMLYNFFFILKHNF